MARALIASLIATAVVSALIYVNVRLGFLPTFNLPAEISNFNMRLGLPATEEAAWVVHCIIGVIIWGVAFAVIRPVLVGSGIGEGLVFGGLAFLAMMTFFMPLAGRQIFAQDLGVTFIVGALALNMVYGGVLGAALAALEESGPERFGR